MNDLARRRDITIVKQKSELERKPREIESKNSIRLNVINLISRKISKLFDSIHEKYNKIKQHLSLQVTDMDDPCELRQTAGYRFAYATRITNDAWIINLRATLA